MRPCGHAQLLRDGRFVIALGAGNRLVLLVLEALALHVVVAVAGLAAQTRILAQAIARLALEVLRLQNLARRLVLELVIFAEECVAKAAPKHSATVVPHTSLTLHADGVLQSKRSCNNTVDQQVGK